ncbi:MAG: tRNA (adenosine(37)-N6)-dimethylallyltransferase MiaA [Oceanospirillales bacterium]|nr:MAG: tRNA (adenosine(37)-N6)-dimethylallyltransferase MiaA [Oceanospirillales bacterium]
MGPTASGKTDLAMQIADHLPVELISVDSALIYKGMDLGTAKPDSETLQRYPHQLVDIKDPSESYSAAEFREDVLRLIQQAQENGRLPLLVGGTMMYFNALLKGMAELPASDPELRAELDQRIKNEGIERLHAQLQVLDPESAKRLHPTDTQRVQRALEVFLLTGKSLTSHWQAQQKVELPFEPLCIGLMPADRAWLHQRIALRFQIMLAAGFEQEVASLYQRGDLHEGLPSIRCVGYRQMWQYFKGQLNYQQMSEKSVVATRQLAKRQYTWLRSWNNLHQLSQHKQNNLQDCLKLIEGRVI